MAEVELSSQRAAVEPLPENLKSVQPGGGVCYAIEVAYGRLRRWWLKRFRASYVRRMAALRQGSADGAPHEILDPRDLKYTRNQCTCFWNEADDPFHWRERIPLARWGLAEVQLIGYPLIAATVALAFCPWPYLAAVPGVLAALVVYFFRDPPRRVPQEPGQYVAPCDGKIAEISPLEFDPFIGGPAVKIGIFLSIFNVHINRVPAKGRVIALRYFPGEFLNALDPASAIRNESLWIGLEEDDAPHRRSIVRQIAGMYARRIVCQLRPGEVVERGAKFGMIKLGSRTELIVPAEEGLRIAVRVGQKVQGGSSVLATYGPTESES